MPQSTIYRVIAHKGGTFELSCGLDTFTTPARGNLKRTGILVGDMVEYDGNAITRVLPRTNSLIRPSVANIDQAIVIVAPVPMPDFYLIDKMLVNCKVLGIGAVICVNKIDIEGAEGLVATLKRQFDSDAKIVTSSVAAKDTLRLRRTLSGKLSALCGQSAVGKSSLVNAITRNNDRNIGELSGNLRGRNTTTRSGIVALGGDTFVIDTPGFGNLDIFGIEYRELDNYYADYLLASSGCRFRGCSHIVEPDCAVRELVERGKLDEDRYIRFVEMYTELKMRSV